MSSALHSADHTALYRDAGRAASMLVRRFGLPAADCADLRHDILVDLIARMGRFDPLRGTLGAFAAVIIRHSVARLATLLRQDRARSARMTLDDPISGWDGVTLLDTFAEDEGYLAWIGSSINPIAALEDRLSINRALNTLGPEHIRLCAEVVTGSIGRMGGESRPSRATLYRQPNEVRLQLLAAGIGPRA